jgi:hypothetical protein
MPYGTLKHPRPLPEREPRPHTKHPKRTHHWWQRRTSR